jgi:hypothetical protein
VNHSFFTNVTNLDDFFYFFLRKLGGGKRPTFGSGGKQADRIRPITGSHYPSGSGGEYSPVYTGAYKAGTITGQYLTGGGSGANIPVLDISLVHPVGADVAPVNTSMRIWRRTA